MAGRGYRPVQARRGAAALTLLGSVKRCCHVNAVDDRQVSRAAGDCASPACQASWVSSVRGPWCGTPNSGEGNEDVRPCSNTECAASALLLCASCTLCSLWVWARFGPWLVVTLWLLAVFNSASKHRLLESQTAVPQSVGTVANKAGRCGRYTLSGRGQSFSCELYTVGELQTQREAFNRTVNSAKAHGLSTVTCASARHPAFILRSDSQHGHVTQIVCTTTTSHIDMRYLRRPWVWLGGGSRRVVASYAGRCTNTVSI